MAVAFVTTGTGYLNGGTGAQTLITGFNPGASNLAVFMSACDGSDSITAVTLNGVSMTSTFVTGSTGGGYCGMHAYYLANPTTGNLVVTTSGGDYSANGVITFSGADTGTPLGTWQNDGTQVGSTDTTPTITGGDANGMYLNFTNYYHGGSAGAVTFGGGETSRIEIQYDGRISLFVSTKAGSASTTLSTTSTGGSRINVAGVYINAAAGGGGGLVHRGLMLGIGT